mmetsp:Transcript_41821/g.40168  ORF Transcript_41821/g.40168 Transcript_41821/m.40168 type:complete len:124 (-) Transcript_41821:172-543(-)
MISLEDGEPRLLAKNTDKKENEDLLSNTSIPVKNNYYMDEQTQNITPYSIGIKTISTTRKNPHINLNTQSHSTFTASKTQNKQKNPIINLEQNTMGSAQFLIPEIIMDDDSIDQLPFEIKEVK